MTLRKRLAAGTLALAAPLGLLALHAGSAAADAVPTCPSSQNSDRTTTCVRPPGLVPKPPIVQRAEVSASTNDQAGVPDDAFHPDSVVVIFGANFAPDDIVMFAPVNGRKSWLSAPIPTDADPTSQLSIQIPAQLPTGQVYLYVLTESSTASVIPASDPYLITIT
ncbi:MAG: hypothetical protein ACJ73S_21320 [Mycobacteriales bacterium]|jgi:hypothetical protein